jgi:hypothetical protein
MLPLFFSRALSLSSAVAKQTYPVPLGRPDRSLVNRAPFLHTLNPEDQSENQFFGSRTGLNANSEYGNMPPCGSRSANRYGTVRYTSTFVDPNPAFPPYKS